MCIFSKYLKSLWFNVSIQKNIMVTMIMNNAAHLDDLIDDHLSVLITSPPPIIARKA